MPQVHNKAIDEHSQSGGPDKPRFFLSACWAEEAVELRQLGEAGHFCETGSASWETAACSVIRRGRVREVRREVVCNRKGPPRHHVILQRFDAEHKIQNDSTWPFLIGWSHLDETSCKARTAASGFQNSCTEFDWCPVHSWIPKVEVFNSVSVLQSTVQIWLAQRQYGKWHHGKLRSHSTT
jgi:hypothetical protein